MVHFKHHGKRCKSRQKFTKKVRERGAPNVNVFMRSFGIGDTVHVHVNSSVHSGMPHRRFHGLTGLVREIRGGCYLVEITDKNSTKRILVHPAHLIVAGKGAITAKKAPARAKAPETAAKPKVIRSAAVARAVKSINLPR